MRGKADSGIAVLSMLTGQPYETVIADFARSLAIKEHVEVSDWLMRDYLGQHGFAVAGKFRSYMPARTLRQNWPIRKPFAYWHYVQVFYDDSAVQFRFVLWHWSGYVIDPHPNYPNNRSIADYNRVNLVAGVVKLPDLSAFNYSFNYLPEVHDE